MQVIDILCNDGETPAPRLKTALKVRKRFMGSVRLHGFHAATPGVIKLMHQRGVGGETFRRRHLPIVVFRPNPTRIAKGRDPGLGGNARTGQDDNIVGCFAHLVRNRQEITLANIYAELTQDQVRRRDMEIEIGQNECLQISET